jgi:DNA-binding transcriptional LysR family regulator
MLGNIWDGIEALAALEQLGTISEAATRLRLTQSAVSKRLQALAAQVGHPIIAREGRRVSLTPEGVDLLGRARPLLAGLRELAQPRLRADDAPSSLSIALADSIAASWGPRVLAEAVREVPRLALELHAHRTALLVEAVRLGRYQVGLATELGSAGDLVHHRVADERMVLLRSGLAPGGAGRPRSRDGGRALITIEPRSATWRAIEPALRVHAPALLARRIAPVESFPAAVQMVRAGFGDGLVPHGLVLELGLPRPAYRVVAGVTRPVSLVTRKTVHLLPRFAALREALVAATRGYFGG